MLSPVNKQATKPRTHALLFSGKWLAVVMILLTMTVFQYRKISRLEKQLASTRQRPIETNSRRGTLVGTTELFQKSERPDYTRFRSELSKLRDEYEKLRAKNEALIATNATLESSTEQWMERSLNTRAYALGLENLLDNVLQQTAPDQSQAVQDSMAIGPGDSVRLGKDLAWSIFGSGIPHVLTNLFENQGQTEVEVTPFLLERYGITNYEQLLVQGFTNFTVIRPEASLTNESVKSPFRLLIATAAFGSRMLTF